MTNAKQALVTGATGGVGLALLKVLGAAGWSVTGVYRGDADRAREAIQVWPASPELLDLRACDLSDADDVVALHAALPAGYCPDALIHLAAPPFTAQPIHKTAWPDFARQLDGILKPVVQVTQPLARRMLRRGHGRIITVLSMVVVGDPPRGFSSYTAAKYALAGYMKSLATEYAGRGISANSVSPGPMDTAQLRELPEMLREHMKSSSPGGWLDPSAVARTILWLAAEAGPEVTGCNIQLIANGLGQTATGDLS